MPSRFALCLALSAGSPAFGEVPLLSEVEREVKKTIQRVEQSLRLPLESRTVFSEASGPPSAPELEQFFATEENMLLIGGRGVGGSVSVRLPSQGAARPKEDAGETKILITSVPMGQRPKALGRNPRYTFELIRATKGEGWLLTEVIGTEEPSAHRIEKSLTRYLDSVKSSVGTFAAVDGRMELESLFRMEGFHLISATQPFPMGLVKVRFTRQFRGRPELTIDCEHTFDPASGWLPVEWSESYTSPERSRSLQVSSQVRVGDGFYESESNVVSKLEIKDPKIASEFGLLGPRNESRKVKFTLEAVEEIPDSRFTLTAFGLPEPAGFEHPVTPLYVWLLAAAAAALGLAVVFGLLARRRAG